MHDHVLKAHMDLTFKSPKRRPRSQHIHMIRKKEPGKMAVLQNDLRPLGQFAFTFSRLVLTSPTPTLLGMPPELREIILGHAIADIMGTHLSSGRLRNGVSIADQVAYRKHLFLSGKRTFFALLVTCRRIRWDMPRVIHLQLRSRFNGWRDPLSRKQLLRQQWDRNRVDERWSFLLKALIQLEGTSESEKQESKDLKSDAKTERPTDAPQRHQAKRLLSFEEVAKKERRQIFRNAV